jgi:hypothetical protein
MPVSTTPQAAAPWLRARIAAGWRHEHHEPGFPEFFSTFFQYWFSLYSGIH